MAAALWILGDTEDEVHAERIRHGLQEAGKVMSMPGRSRYMQRVEPEEQPEDLQPSV